jgi:hypothetical protein
MTAAPSGFRLMSTYAISNAIDSPMVIMNAYQENQPQHFSSPPYDINLLKLDFNTRHVCSSGSAGVTRSCLLKNNSFTNGRLHSLAPLHFDFLRPHSHLCRNTNTVLPFANWLLLGHPLCM